MKNIKNTEAKYANCRGGKLVELVAVEVNEGDGTSNDPVTRVLYLYAKDGTFVAKSHDDYERLFYKNDFMILKSPNTP